MQLHISKRVYCFWVWLIFFILCFLMLIDILWAIAWEARIHQESFEYCGGLALANSQMPSYLLTPSLNRTGGINRTNKKEKFIS